MATKDADEMPTLLAPGALQRSAEEAIARMVAEHPGANGNEARVRFNTSGATVSIYTRLPLGKRVEGQVGGYVTRTWKGDITGEGEVILRW